MIVVVLLIVAAFTQVYLNNKQILRMTDDKLSEFSNTIRASLEDHLSHLQSKYTEFSVHYQNSNRVEQYMKTNDKEGLYKYISSDYNSLRRLDEHLDVMHFYDTKNVTILRVHRPELYDDDLTDVRPMLRYVNENKVVKSGFEVGKSGLTYRITIPMINFLNQHYGVLEYGVNLNYFADEMTSKNGDVQAEVLVKSDNLKNLAEEKKYEKLNEYSVVGTTPLMRQLKTNIDFEQKLQLIEQDSKTYMLINDLNFNDFNGETAARIILAKDITSLMQEYRHDLLIMNLLNLLIFIVITVIIYFEFDKYSKKIEQLKLDIMGKEKELYSQSRLANIGEMISMIAHQWRQPLGAISSTILNLQTKLELEVFDLSKEEGVQSAKEYFTQRLSSIDGFVQNLTTTIDNFRNFYKPNKKMQKATFQELVEEALGFMENSIKSQGVVIASDYQSAKELQFYKDEMMQVILNVLKNAQENFKDKKTLNPTIIITTKENSVIIRDNGGGVSNNIIEKIFDPYFSTKDEKNGTGLGLYMSKIIVEDHHGGKFYVENKDDGACFTIELFGGVKNDH